MLTNIKLGNFKSWRELDIDLAPITLLYGTNSSGKTSILQALLLLKQTMFGADRGLSINFGGNDNELANLGNFGEVVFDHNYSLDLSIEVGWNFSKVMPYLWGPTNSLPRPGNTDDMKFTIEWGYLGEIVVVNEIEYSIDFGTTNRYSFVTSKDRDKYQLIFTKGAESKSRHRVDLEGFYPNYNSLYAELPETDWLASLNRQLSSIFQYTSYIGPIRQSAQRAYFWNEAPSLSLEASGRNMIEALIYSKRNLSITTTSTLLDEVSFWLTNLELAQKFEVKAIDANERFYEIRVIPYRGKIESSIVDVGYGISQILPIVVALYYMPAHSIFIIEQPELHLHPSAQAHLADLFLEVAEKRDLQLIIESHSEHLLRRFQRRIAEPENTFATPENIKAYFCKAGEEGSTIQPVEVDEYGQIRNWPDNFFGDLGGDLDAMMDAGLERRRQELGVGG